MPAPKYFTSWSFSRYWDWNQCPAKANWKYIVKLKTPEMTQRDADLRSGKLPPGPLERGAEIADQAKNYLKGKIKQVPAYLMPVATVYRELKKKGSQLTVEDSWGFTKQWMPCSPTDWDRCWLRITIDVAFAEPLPKNEGEGDILHIRDNKSGKFDERKAIEYQEQLELYGAAGFCKYPTVQAVDAQLIYSDLGILHPKVPMKFSVDELPLLQRAWEKRVRPMMNDRRFPPRPGYYCRWCDFSKARGGPCKF